MTLLDDYRARPARYENIDGSAEIGVGLTLLGWSVAGAVLEGLPTDAVWRNGPLGLGVQNLAPIAAAALGWWSSRLIKKHITWNRTGYAEPRADRPVVVTIAVAFVLAAILGGAVALSLKRADSGNGAVFARLLTASIWLGCYALMVGRISPEHRRWKLALASAGLAILIPAALLTDVSMNHWMMSSMLLAAVLWLASGGMTLFLYLRRTEPLAQEVE